MDGSSWSWTVRSSGSLSVRHAREGRARTQPRAQTIRGSVARPRLRVAARSSRPYSVAISRALGTVVVAIRGVRDGPASAVHPVGPHRPAGQPQRRRRPQGLDRGGRGRPRTVRGCDAQRPSRRGAPGAEPAFRCQLRGACKGWAHRGSGPPTRYEELRPTPVPRRIAGDSEREGQYRAAPRGERMSAEADRRRAGGGVVHAGVAR
jgi:hypothetical protein